MQLYNIYLNGKITNIGNPLEYSEALEDSFRLLESFEMIGQNNEAIKVDFNEHQFCYILEGVESGKIYAVIDTTKAQNLGSIFLPELNFVLSIKPINN